MVFDIDSTLKNASGIYEITNSVNSKRYVGSSKNLAQRFSVHRKQLGDGRHHSVLLQRFADKHGMETLRFSLLEACPVEALIEREQFYMDMLGAHSAKGGYNSSPTAQSVLGVKHSAEARAANAERKKGNTNRLGIAHTAEARAKMSASKKGKMTSAAQIEAMRQANLTRRVYATGFAQTPEALVKREATRAARRAQIGPSYGAKPEDYKARKSAAMKEYYRKKKEAQ